jgi:hypothetical protein
MFAAGWEEIKSLSDESAKFSISLAARNVGHLKLRVTSHD